MNINNVILLLGGVIITLIFFVSFSESKSFLDIFKISIGIMVILIGFYNEDKKINYLRALFCLNVVQWLILIYIYYNQIYVKTDFYYYLIGVVIITITLVSQIRKINIKSIKNSQKTNISILKDKTKSILLFTGIIIIIGCLAGFIAYSPIFVYGITLGMMMLIVGFYREDRKVNVSLNFAKAMSSVFILQWIIIIYFTFTRQFSGDDFVNTFTFSMVIMTYFFMEISKRDIRLFKIFKEEEILIDPDKNTLYNKGKAHQKLLRYREALECYEKTLKIDPSFEPALKAKEEVLKLIEN